METPENNEQKKSIKTYAEDLAGAVENAKGGAIKKMIEEQEGIEKQEENLSPESNKNKMLMLLSALFVILAFGVIFFLIKSKGQIPSPVQSDQSAQIIYTDKNQFLKIDDLSKDEIIQSIKNEVSAADVKQGGIEAIYLTENNQVVGFKRFMELIRSNVPPEVLAYTNDNFMIGVWNGETQALFILLQVDSFTDIFPGMKIWENKMFFDLHGLFGTEISTETNYLLSKDFENSVAGNKNARALYDKDGKMILEYVFANETSVIIIAQNEAVKEVMLRLSNMSRLKQ